MLLWLTAIFALIVLGQLLFDWRTAPASARSTLDYIAGLLFGLVLGISVYPVLVDRGLEPAQFARPPLIIAIFMVAWMFRHIGRGRTATPGVDAPGRRAGT